MDRDLLLSVACVLLGAMWGFLGGYAYLGRDAPAFFHRARQGAPRLVGKGIVMAFMPFGLGMVTFGVAFLIGRNAVTLQMLVVGLGLFVVGWIVFFIHPKKIQPRWLRDDPMFESGEIFW